MKRPIQYQLYVKRLAACVQVPDTSAISRNFQKRYPDIAGLHCIGATIEISKVPDLAFRRNDGKPLTATDVIYLKKFYNPLSPVYDLLSPLHPVRVGDS